MTLKKVIDHADHHTREELLEEAEEAREAKLHAAAQARKAAIEKGNAETRAAMKSLAMASNYATQKETIVSNNPETELENGQQQGAQPMTEAASTKTEIRPNGGTPPKPMAPVTVGNPASASSMAIDQQHLEEFASAEESPSTIECRRPPKGQFFTVRPETTNPWRDREFYYLLQLEGRDALVVAPSIAKQKSEEDTIRPILLVRYVTMAGEEGLWPVKLDQQDGKSNRWNRSALTILELASSGKWVRIM